MNFTIETTLTLSDVDGDEIALVCWANLRLRCDLRREQGYNEQLKARLAETMAENTRLRGELNRSKAASRR